MCITSISSFTRAIGANIHQLVEKRYFMKSIIKSAVVFGLAVSFSSPGFAFVLDQADPVAASFIRDLDREPTSQTRSVVTEQDLLPEMFRTELAFDTKSWPGIPESTRHN